MVQKRSRYSVHLDFMLPRWLTQGRSFWIKTLNDDHKHVRDYDISHLMHPCWLARHFLEELMMKPNLKCKEMQSRIKTKFLCGLSWSKAYRIRYRTIMRLIHAKLTNHYERVWDYSSELIRLNANNTVQVGVTINPDQTTYFHKMYICFKGVKECWKIRFIG